MLPPGSGHDLQALVHPHCLLFSALLIPFRTAPATDPADTFSSLRTGPQMICCRKKHLCHHLAWVYTHGAEKGTHSPFCRQQVMLCLLSPPATMGMGQSNRDPPRSNTCLGQAGLRHKQHKQLLGAYTALICSSETEPTSHPSSPTIQEDCFPT